MLPEDREPAGSWLNLWKAARLTASGEKGPKTVLHRLKASRMCIGWIPLTGNSVASGKKSGPWRGGELSVITLQLQLSVLVYTVKET